MRSLTARLRSAVGDGFVYGFGDVGLATSIDCFMTHVCHGRADRLPAGLDEETLSDLMAEIEFHEVSARPLETARRHRVVRWVVVVAAAGRSANAVAAAAVAARLHVCRGFQFVVVAVVVSLCARFISFARKSTLRCISD